MGMDNSHSQWIKTNDDRETYESWQCSVAEGYRTRIVKREVSSPVKELIEAGKVVGPDAYVGSDRDDDANANDDEDKDNVVRIPRQAPGFEEEIDHYHETSKDEEWRGAFGQELSKYKSDTSSIFSDDASQIGVQEDLTDSEIDDEEMKKRRQEQDKNAAKEELHRKHRGTMNIKRVRNLKFLKDEVKVAGHKLKDKFSMKGREPGGNVFHLLLLLLLSLDILVMVT
jgi:hypothetical protein